MKKIAPLILLSIFTTTLGYSETQALPNSNSHGIIKYQNDCVDSICSNGLVTLENMNVNGPVQVKGNLTAEKTTMDSLKVHGLAKLKDCTIHATTSIYGYLDAESTAFKNKIEAFSRKVSLKSCSVDSIFIPKSNDLRKIPVIELLSGTTVTGSITIESGNGEIWLSFDSEILGEVHGATIKKK